MWSKENQGAEGIDYDEIFLAVQRLVVSKTSAMICQDNRPNFYFEKC